VNRTDRDSSLDRRGDAKTVRAEEHPSHPPARWSADRELTLELVRVEVAEQFPRLRPLEVRYVGSGWDYDAYLANATWLFRFPRRRDVDEMLEREMAILNRLPALPGARIPQPELTGRPSPRFPYRFFGYRFIPGCGADELSPARLDRSGLAEQLGATLSTLHASDPTDLIALGVPEEREEPQSRLDSVIESAPVIRRALAADLDEPCAPYLSGAVEVPPPYGGPRRLIHNDIGIEHLIFDPRTGLLAGIIDWEDTSTGDPAFDFTGLRCWLGAGFVEEVLRHYPIGVDGGFRERLGFLARAQALEWLGEALLKEGPDSLQVAWVRTAFLDG